MRHAVNYMVRGNATWPDNIFMDTIEDGHNLINIELEKLFSACRKRGKVPQQWIEANIIIIYKK